MRNDKNIATRVASGWEYSEHYCIETMCPSRRKSTLPMRLFTLMFNPVAKIAIRNTIFTERVTTCERPYLKTALEKELLLADNNR